MDHQYNIPKRWFIFVCAIVFIIVASAAGFLFKTNILTTNKHHNDVLVDNIMLSTDMAIELLSKATMARADRLARSAGLTGMIQNYEQGGHGVGTVREIETIRKLLEEPWGEMLKKDETFVLSIYTKNTRKPVLCLSRNADSPEADDTMLVRSVFSQGRSVKGIVLRGQKVFLGGAAPIYGPKQEESSSARKIIGVVEVAMDLESLLTGNEYPISMGPGKNALLIRKSAMPASSPASMTLPEITLNNIPYLLTYGSSPELVSLLGSSKVQKLFQEKHQEGGPPPPDDDPKMAGGGPPPPGMGSDSTGQGAMPYHHPLFVFAHSPGDYVWLGDKVYGIQPMPFRFQRSLDESPNPDGLPNIMIVLWDDIVPLYNSLGHDVATYSGGALLTYLLLVGCLYLAWRKGRGKLQKLIDRQSKQLRELELNMARMNENALLGIFQASVGNGMISLNPAGAAILGFATPDQALEHREQMRQSLEHDRQRFDRFMKELTDHKKVTMFEMPIKDANGKTRWLMISATIQPSREYGEIFEGYVLDMTAEHQARAALKESREQLRSALVQAKEASKSKSEFLARMSHEIRTPMNAVIGLAHLCLQTSMTARQHDYIKKIEASGHNLLGIINDILDFSKVEAGQMTVEHIHFDLVHVMNNLANVTSLKAHEKDLDLLLLTPPDIPVSLVGDPLRLGQVLINLVNNAIKFTVQGEIRVSVSQVKADSQTTTLSFEVSDTGIGIAPDKIETLFDSFTQVDESVTRRYGGTGLGLTICKQLVELMGGTLTVKSALGKGTSFIATIPFGISDIRIDSLTTPRELKDMRILLATSGKQPIKTLCSILQSSGFQVMVADTGEKALEALSRETPGRDAIRLAMLDAVLPDMDNLTLADRIRTLPGWENLPCLILISALDSEEIIAKSVSKGMDTVLVKPLNQSALLEAIMKTMGYETSRRVRSARKDDGLSRAMEKIRGARILLAEDNEINRLIARDLLQKYGLVVEEAHNGRQAFEMAQEASYDLILMDIQMPEMCGLESSRRIRQAFVHNREVPPIVAMTAHAMAGDREKSLAAGMVDHLTKPINPDELYAALLRYIPGKITANSAENALAANAPLGSPESGNGAFPDLPGIDTRLGLTRVGGNQNLYVHVLKMLRDKYASNPAFVRELLAQGKHDEALRLAHSLKGLGGNVGALYLQEAASELETSMQESPEADVESLLTTLEHALISLGDSLKNLDAIDGEAEDMQPQSQVVVAPNSDTARETDLAFLKYLTQLGPHLRLGEPRQTREIMKQIQASPIPEDMAEVFLQVASATKHYRFKEAAALVDTMTIKLNERMNAYD